MFMAGIFKLYFHLSLACVSNENTSDFSITFEIQVSRALHWNLCQINFWDSMKLKMNS